MSESVEARKMFLAQRMAWPLAGKVRHAENTVREWYNAHEGNVAVNTSGKDSWVLAHIVRSLFQDVPLVFADTGMEFPEVRRFNRERCDVVLRPLKPFAKVVKEDGWPVVSKVQAQYIRQARMDTGVSAAVRMTGIRPNGEPTKFCISQKWRYLRDAPFTISEACCHYLKTGPLDAYHKANGSAPFVGTRVDESQSRRRQWVQHGCNAFDKRHPASSPLSFFTEADVWEYVKAHGIALPEVYAMGYKRTGCVLCAFGAHLEKSPNRFQMLHETHPKLWEWGMHKLGMAEVLDYCGIAYRPERRLL